MSSTRRGIIFDEDQNASTRVRWNPQVEKALLALLVVSQTFLTVPYLRELVVIGLFVYALFRLGQTRGEDRVSLWSNPFLMLTLVWAFFSTFWSLDPRATFLSVGSSFAVLFLVCHFKSVLSARQIIEGLSTGLKFLILASVVLELLYSRGIVFSERSIDAFHGVTANPNLLGFLAVVSTMVFITQEKKRPILDWTISLVWVSASLYLLFNTSAGAAPFYLLIAIAVYIVARVIRRQKYLALPGMLFIAALAIWVSQESVRSWLATLVGADTNETLSGRTHLWSVAGDAIQRNPIFGYGLTSFTDISVAPTQDLYALWASFDFGAFSSHNGYIEILLHLGVVGFILVISTLLVAGWRSFKYPNLDYFAILVVIILYNFSEVRFFTPPLAWLLVAIVAVNGIDRRSAKRSLSRKDGEMTT